MNLNILENEKTPLVIALLEIINEQAKKIEALEQEKNIKLYYSG